MKQDVFMENSLRHSLGERKPAKYVSNALIFFTFLNRSLKNCTMQDEAIITGKGPN